MHNPFISRLSAAVVLVVSVLSTGGCSGGVGNLYGKVTYNGQTVTSGIVACIGSDGVARYCTMMVPVIIVP